jgi:ethanolamine utilization protein EutJ
MPVAAVDHSLAASTLLERAAGRLRRPGGDWSGQLRFGVDLGTTTIVLCAVDKDDEPVYWDFVPEQAVRDGVVVDFRGAVRAVAELKGRAESVLRLTVARASTAHPPGVPRADGQACRYVLEQAGIECRALTDEVSAAQTVLRVRDGLITDVGGGSTGVGRFQDGRLVSLSDHPGGGRYLDLILAGALGVPVEEAEVRKRRDGLQYLHILRPGIERIAASIRQQCDAPGPHPIHLAGGALLLSGAARVIESYLGWPTVAYPHADLITPFGIACS